METSCTVDRYLPFHKTVIKRASHNVSSVFRHPLISVIRFNLDPVSPSLGTVRIRSL